MARVKSWKQVVEGIEVEVLEFESTVESVDKASRLSGYPPNHIVKTLLLKTQSGYVVAVVRGDRRVDLVRASRALGGRVELAKPHEVKVVLGVEPGAVTPLSPSIKNLRVIADPLIAGLDFVVCGGGTLNRLFKIKTKDLLYYLKPEFLEIFT